MLSGHINLYLKFSGLSLMTAKKNVFKIITNKLTDNMIYRADELQTITED